MRSLGNKLFVFTSGGLCTYFTDAPRGSSDTRDLYSGELTSLDPVYMAALLARIG